MSLAVKEVAVAVVVVVDVVVIGRVKTAPFAHVILSGYLNWCSFHVARPRPKLFDIDISNGRGTVKE